MYESPQALWISDAIISAAYYPAMLQLSLLLQLFTSLSPRQSIQICLLSVSSRMTTSRPRHILAAAPSRSLQWANIHLWRLFTIVQISPQTKWSNQFVCHYSSQQWIRWSHCKRQAGCKNKRQLSTLQSKNAMHWSILFTRVTPVTLLKVALYRSNDRIFVRRFLQSVGAFPCSLWLCTHYIAIKT